jgi:pimeloyl-ACP methyl ester carboxylesterase
MLRTAGSFFRKVTFALITVILFSCLVHADAAASGFEKRVITIADDVKIFTEVSRGDANKPVFVLLNGLIYDLSRWDKLADALAAQGFTVVRYAFSGQPENLRLLEKGGGKGGEPKFFKTGLSLQMLAGELDQVLAQLQITSHQLNIVGLSYGASVAAEYAVRFPEKVDSTIFISPLVIPLDYYNAGGNSVRAWLGVVRFWEDSPCDFYGVVNPWLCSARDYWYDSFYNYLYEHFVFERIQGIPEGVDESAFKKSVFHLVRAARDFDLRTYAPHLSNVHILVAGEDDAQLRRDQEQTWNELPQTERRSFVVFKGAEHALPDAAPLATADILSAIGRKRPELQTGSQYEVPGNR